MQHLVLAFALAHLLNVAVGEPWTPTLFAAVFLGALLPDIDHRKTRIFKFALVSVFAVVFAAAYPALALENPARVLAAAGLAGAAALIVLAIKPRHRGITHHPLAAAAFALMLFGLTREPWAAANGFLAYASHFLSDRLF